jgi:hypothetical protein
MYHASIQGTMFRRENGVWFANYARNGKRQRVSLGTKDKRLAHVRLSELLAHPSDRTIMMAQCIQESLTEMEYRKLKSVYVVRCHSKSVVLAFGSYKVWDIAEKIIQ